MCLIYALAGVASQRFQCCDSCPFVPRFSPQPKIPPEEYMKITWLELLAASLLLLSNCGTPQSPTTNSTMQLHSENAASDEITPATNPDATFKGCWYKQGKNRYQAVDVSVKNPGKYAFNALLYHGTTCNPNDYADQFGFGQLLNFGGSGYIFWFNAFANKTDMSALWYVGADKSQCINYENAPEC
jgi:hypothetical protein